MATQISHNDVKTDRHLYIGGSDIGAIMGVSPFKTPFKLWCEKTQKIPAADLSKNDAVRMGTVLEDFIAQEFAYRNGVQVRRAPKDYTHKDFPFLKAHVDRLITGSNEGLECKNTGEYNYKLWKGSDMPEAYILQCQWYMGITGRKKWNLAALIGGNKYQDKPLEFDAELFDMMVEAACEFWDMVQNDVPPPLTSDDNDALAELYSSHGDDYLELYRGADDKMVSAVNSFEESVAFLQETKAQIKTLSDTQKEIEAKIKNLIKDNVGIKTPKYVVSWKQQSKSGVNIQKLKDDGLYEKYSSETSYRVLRVANNKGVA